MNSIKTIPLHSAVLELLDIQSFEELELPFVASYVSAGFPSPAEDYVEDKIDLGRYLVQNPSSTYFMRVRGNSMQDANIHEGDVLVIDKSLKPADGLPVICFLNGEFTVKTFSQSRKGVFLLPANPVYAPIEITEEMDMRVWGVVVWVLHKPVKR
ncbi:LexA family protein [Pontibacter liquoris]|uniref:LexA family protein n=1 Tax=Pontibacter liquoris TaxID=2905677 RepID=UPI001FA6B1A2|nr:translesion error-prone DNA polymerase V autoproteolytic subunit [Pontibacter liquoris]